MGSGTPLHTLCCPEITTFKCKDGDIAEWHFLLSFFIFSNIGSKRKKYFNVIVISNMWMLWRDQDVTLPSKANLCAAALSVHAGCCPRSPLHWQSVAIDFLRSPWEEVLLSGWWLQRVGDPVLIPMLSLNFYISARAQAREASGNALPSSWRLSCRNYWHLILPLPCILEAHIWGMNH